jgi:iron-sulfur cluster assembly accessory protein
MQDGIFEFAKAQRKYWEKKRQDDNYRIGTKQSEPNPQWGWLPRDLEGGGCSGYQIKLKGASDIPSDAQMLSDTIFSDTTSLDLLGDTVMDWSDDPFKPAFKFTPPSGSHSCGCGSSFQLD